MAKQNWTNLYQELAALLLDNVSGLRWVDIWRNQVNYLEEEHPFPSPAVFIGFRILNTSDMGEKVQAVVAQVDYYVFYESFADTHAGSFNQQSALTFLNLTDDLYACMHGSSGTNYFEMRRTGFAPLDTGGAGNLYQMSFTCNLVDYGAARKYVEADGGDIVVQQESPEAEESDLMPIILP